MTQQEFDWIYDGLSALNAELSADCMGARFREVTAHMGWMERHYPELWQAYAQQRWPALYPTTEGRCFPMVYATTAGYEAYGHRWDAAMDEVA